MLDVWQNRARGGYYEVQELVTAARIEKSHSEDLFFLEIRLIITRC